MGCPGSVPAQQQDPAGRASRSKKTVRARALCAPVSTVSTYPAGPDLLCSHADIDSLYWTRVTRGCQLGVRVKDGITVNFIGFREKVGVHDCVRCVSALSDNHSQPSSVQDYDAISAFCQQHFKQDLKVWICSCHDMALLSFPRQWMELAPMCSYFHPCACMP